VEGFAQVTGQRRVMDVEQAQCAVDAGGDGFAGLLGVVAQAPGTAAPAD